MMRKHRNGRFRKEIKFDKTSLYIYMHIIHSFIRALRLKCRKNNTEKIHRDLQFEDSLLSEGHWIYK